MISFLTELNKQFRTVEKESYFEQNSTSQIKYPYVTYNFDSETIERNVDGFYIDVDVFDANSSYKNIFLIEDKLKTHFKDNRKLTDDFFIRFNFLRSSKVPTADDNIKRRNMQFYCKIDWRKK